jgi:hypothetical protein
MGMRWQVLKELLWSKQPIVGAEIGVMQGNMTFHVLSSLPSIRKYYAIDSWEYYPELGKSMEKIPEGFQSRSGRNQESMDNNYRMFVKNFITSPLLDFKDKVVLLKMFSCEACKHIENGSLDFCFIDGNHSYESVKEDIQNYLPKIKSGGLLAGHDYRMPGTGVKKAVDEIFDCNRIKTSTDWVWCVWT